MRKKLVILHLWLSLLLGLFIVVICTTGSLLLIEKDIERLISPQLFSPTEGRVPLQIVQQNVETAYPGHRITRIEMPADDGLYHIRISKQSLYIDPGSGQILGPAEEGRSSFFATVLQLHRYLLAGDWLGKPKASIVAGFMGLGFILILLTGAFLWWPGIRKLASGVKITLSRSRMARNFSLHKTIGIVTLPFLLVFAVTGTAFQLDRYILGWLGVSTKAEIPKSWTQVTQSAPPALSLDDIVQLAEATYPDSQLIRLQLSDKPGQTVQLPLQEGYSPSGNANTAVYMDPYNGQILGKTNPNTAMNLYTSWRRGLHFAAWGGKIVTYLGFIVGMMPLALMITGLVVWQIKARARKKKAVTAKKAPVQGGITVQH